MHTCNSSNQLAQIISTVKITEEKKITPPHPAISLAIICFFNVTQKPIQHPLLITVVPSMVRH